MSFQFSLSRLLSILVLDYAKKRREKKEFLRIYMTVFMYFGDSKVGSRVLSETNLRFVKMRREFLAHLVLVYELTIIRLIV